MKTRLIPRKATLLAAAGLALALCAGPAVAERGGGQGNQGIESDEGPGQGHGHGHGPGGPGAERGRGSERGPTHGGPGAGHFASNDRMAVQGYFAGPPGDRGCPPGLARKDNGCMPPGQARKWAVGHPLPPGVVTYPLPSQLLVQLTPPPAGCNYVRVAGDILMIGAGTRMVIDAIQDLGR